jgi:hypothetical protein
LRLYRPEQYLECTAATSGTLPDSDC